MNQILKISIVLITLIFTFTGCTTNNMNSAMTTPTKRVSPVKNTLNATIVDLAQQLKRSSRLNIRDKGSIAVTTFVDLNLLEKTTYFGRSLGESMFNELFVRGFNVSDFRGAKVITVTPKGEFYITRNVNNISNEVVNKYILVGTYTKIARNILLNVRIVDNHSGKIVASARSIYKNDYCKLNPQFCSSDSSLNKRKIKIVSNDITTMMVKSPIMALNNPKMMPTSGK